MILVSNNIINFDAPLPWGLYFQDSGTPLMEVLMELHNYVMYFLLVILGIVGWILLCIIKRYSVINSPISHKYLSHGSLIELIWTILPVIITIIIAFPSFISLYLIENGTINEASVTIIAEGHQWYWSYQYSDYLDSNNNIVEFDSYIIPEQDLEEGRLRMLEVDNRVIVPESTDIRFVVTSGDVIHSFSCNSLGLKCDAYPGRLNQMSIYINRLGTFYGQCSEICGILHSSMPIVIESVTLNKYLGWLISL
jgi:heme/copper-type cytochrome/quinol oxidase subunit 2